MKTIRELKNEGLISTRLYTNLVRGISFDDKYAVIKKYAGWKERDCGNANELTAKDIVELWTEDEIMKWRGMGQKTLEELKSLI